MGSLDPITRSARRRMRPPARAAEPTGLTHHVSVPRNQPSLTDLLQRVRVALSTVQIYGLTLSSDPEGVVYLDGVVRTEEAFTAAQRLAEATPGVRTVVNRLVVDTLTGSMPVRRTVTSPELAAEIVLNNVQFASPTERSLNDVIGTIDTAIATDEGEPFFPPTDPVVRRAARTEGGYTVVGGFSQTALDAPTDPEQLPRALQAGDDEIARRVRLALAADAGTADLPIFVSVHRGVVRLRGLVPSLADSDLAEEVAARVPGVVEVQDEIDVVGF